MTKDQIQIYEYCKKHLADMESWKLPFSIQKYGTSSGAPRIEHMLQDIHRQMYVKICAIIGGAKNEIQEIIDNI